MKRVHAFGFGVGPLALALALSFGSCGAPQLATAEDALELIEDVEPLDVEEIDSETEPETSDSESELEPETVQIEGEPEPENVQIEGEPEPETVQIEGEPEPETTDRGTEIEQASTTDDVLEHIDAATERLDATVDLLMIGVGALGALLGYLAFGSVWRTLGGER